MTNLLDLPLDQFRGYLAEGNYPQARQDELMRAYRAQNSLSGLLDRYGEEGLEGKNVSTFFPVAGPGGMSIFDALKSGQLQTRFKDYASDALGGVIGALENPKASYDGTLPQADYDSAAMASASLPMVAGGVVAGRLPDGAVAANIPVMQGRSRQGLTDFFNPDGVSWGTDSKSTAEQFAGKDAGLVYKYNDEGKLEVSEADSYLPGQVYDLNYDLENPMQVPIKDTLWTREKELAKIAEAKAKGHDGLKIVHGTPDADGKYPKTDYVAFDPSQVSTVDAKTAKKNRIAEMRRLRRIERFGYDPEEQPAPASGGFDAYLSTVNPSGKRIQSENRPNLRMGDMYGMLPKSAQKVSSVGDVDIMRDGDDFYAVAYNPDVGEMDVVGYAQRGEGETDLMVVQEMQGKGVGGELQYQYRSANPTAPTGGLTEAGEGLLRNTYGRLRDDGTVNANASAPVGLLAAQPSTEDELRQYLMQRGLLQ